MNIGELLEIDNPSSLETKKLKNIAIYSSDAAVNLIEGIGAVGTLMFQNSCSDNDNLNKDIIGKIGLLIQESIIIASALTGNAGLAEDEIKSRSAPPSAIKSLINREMKLLVLLAISTTLNYHYSNLKVIYTKTN
ncbi:TPA: hypothetical protein OOF57_001700 [Morganella morganii]|nr:hypothetical protein [Morganella morganii]